MTETSVLVSTVIFSERAWWLPALVIFAVALSLLFWVYRGASLPRHLRWICGGLKSVGVAALLLCLLAPLGQNQRVKPGANVFLVLADNSQGMQIKDDGMKASRGEQLRQLLTIPESTWQQKLEEDFQVRRYLFDSRLESTPDYAALNFDGKASGLMHALQSLEERFRGRPVAGILILTDGNATDANLKPNLSGGPPVYPVVFGRDDPIKDLALTGITVNESTFEDAPITIRADVEVTGAPQTEIVAQLMGIRSNAVSSVLQELSERTGNDAAKKMAFRFQVKPDRPGVVFYRVRVGFKGARPDESPEATLANNSRVVVVNRPTEPQRILYVTGRPNWEFKFLNRALAEDDQLRLVGLIRIARREPKFEFRGRPGEQSNPLFRGFDRKTEETEKYDQPVLLWLNSHDDAEIKRGFPKRSEDLFSYHAVIVDDVESEFFSADQLALLQKFVSERGGGFLMLGGQESFHKGAYGRTIVADLLPVYVDGVAETKAGSSLRFSLTRDGWVQPWARLRGTESEEKTRIEAMPGFEVFNRVRSLKPGASVIATVTDGDGQQYPALAVQRFGHGRTAALMIGDLWRWGLQQDNQQRDLGKSWRQIVRWLVADVPKPIEIRTDADPADAAQTTRIWLRARDKNFHALDNATVTVTVTPEAGAVSTGTGPIANSPGTPAAAAPPSAMRLNAEPVAGERGLYLTKFNGREGGGYRAEAIVVGGDGLEAGRVSTGWAVDPSVEEFRSLKPNRALMEDLARQTGGEVINPDHLDRFAGSLARRAAPVMEQWTYPLWHQPAVFLFAVICFAAEWWVRRSHGLA